MGRHGPFFDPQRCALRRKRSCDHARVTNSRCFSVRAVTAFIALHLSTAKIDKHNQLALGKPCLPASTATNVCPVKTRISPTKSQAGSAGPPRRARKALLSSQLVEARLPGRRGCCPHCARGSPLAGHAYTISSHPARGMPSCVSVSPRCVADGNETSGCLRCGRARLSMPRARRRAARRRDQPRTPYADPIAA